MSDAHQGADLVRMLRRPLTIPVHFDDYNVFKSPLSHFTHEVQTRQLAGSVRTVLRGETVSLPVLAQ